MRKKPNRQPLGLNVIIREMRLEDMPAVFDIGQRLFTAEKWPTLYRAWDEYEITELFGTDGEFCLVAESESGRVVGFALGTLMQKPRSAWRYGWLLWLGVAPRYAGHGIGARMVHQLTKRFIRHDARMMLVDTDEANAEALEFFRSQGFGHEVRHIYLSKNFENLPGYRQWRAAMRRALRRRGARMLISQVVRGCEAKAKLNQTARRASRSKTLQRATQEGAR